MIKTIEEFVFEKVCIDMSKLEANGFARQGDSFRKDIIFMDGDFRAEITISSEGFVSGRVVDLMMNETYLPLRAAGQSGSYVSQVRYEYQCLLEELAETCGIPLPFAEPLANDLAQFIFRTYGHRPENPFEDTDDAVFRHPENRRWYGLVMTVSGNKIDAARYGESPLMVLNVKADETKTALYHREDGIYPGYHMNHKKWLTLVLDGTVPFDRLKAVVEESFVLTNGGKGSKIRKAGEKKTWIIPANPKYYDIVGVFSQCVDTHWKQGKGIETGDTVYMYVAVPYSAILYRCLVTRAHVPKTSHPELMEVRIEERYKPGQFTLEKMKNFGVTTVRGPRFMPKELAAYIDDNKMK